MRNLTFDVLVVGAGPAGLAAAASAARSGASVGLVDDNPHAGGQIWRGGILSAHSRQATRWFARAAAPNLRILIQTRVIGPSGQHAVLAETATGASWLRYQRLVLAPGARERFLPFPGWTLPGVLGAGGLQALVKGGMPIAGKRVVVAGSGPLLLAVAAFLHDKGARIELIAEQAPWSRLAGFAPRLARDAGKLGQATRLGWKLRRVPFRAGGWVLRAHGTHRIEAVTVRLKSGAWTHPCEYLACGFGLVPNLELPVALGCAVEGGVVSVDQWQQTSVEGVYCAGEATGIGGLEASLVEGQIAGFTATGQWRQAQARQPERARTRRFAAALDRAFAPRDELKHLADADTVVCRCEDVQYRDLQSYDSWRGAKLHTRCGMGPCQGRVCGPATAFLFGWTPRSVRPPITAARIGSLAEYEHSLEGVAR